MAVTRGVRCAHLSALNHKNWEKERIEREKKIEFVDNGGVYQFIQQKSARACVCARSIVYWLVHYYVTLKRRNTFREKQWNGILSAEACRRKEHGRRNWPGLSMGVDRHAGLEDEHGRLAHSSGEHHRQNCSEWIFLSSLITSFWLLLGFS